MKKVCVCGKPNVGKSTLFNRLIGKKKALVLDEPGVTRDVSRVKVKFDGGEEFELADLAGLELFSNRRELLEPKKEPTLELKRLATLAAIEYLKTTDLVLFVIDGREVPTPHDEILSRLIREEKNGEVLLVLSKIEGKVEEQAQIEASRFGWGEGVPTSGEHNLGVENLKDVIVENLFGPIVRQEYNEQEEISDEEVLEREKEQVQESIRGQHPLKPIRIGVYGRPNVGKSTLTNWLLGYNRMITSPIAGTTVDTIDSDFTHEGKFYRILDTAGIRRKSKTEQGVEVLSVVQALKSLDQIDLALFLIDGYEGVTDQDEKVAGEIVKSGKTVIIVVNKWDQCRVKEDDYSNRIREHLGFLDFAPILFISAKQGRGLDSLFDLMSEMIRQRMIEVSTGELNRFLELVEGTNNPQNAKLYYATQTSKNPPTITFLVNDPKKIHFAYERFLKNELRNRYGWMGSPVHLTFKARTRSVSKKVKDWTGNKSPDRYKY